MTPQPPTVAPTKAELKEQLIIAEQQLALVLAQERDKDKMLASRRTKIEALQLEISDIEYRSISAPSRQATLEAKVASLSEQLARVESETTKPPSHSKLVNQLFETVLGRVLQSGLPSPRELAFLRACKSTTRWAQLWDEYKDLEQAT